MRIYFMGAKVQIYLNKTPTYEKFLFKKIKYQF